MTKTFLPKLYKNKRNNWGNYMLTKQYYTKYPGIFDGINITDHQRVNRAINVYEHTGMSLKEWQKKLITCSIS